MSSENFSRECGYQATAAIARTMLSRGVITHEEFCKIDTILLEKYRPVLGGLLIRKQPKNLDK